jgi:hypothetical protein
MHIKTIIVKLILAQRAYSWNSNYTSTVVVNNVPTTTDVVSSTTAPCDETTTTSTTTEVVGTVVVNNVPTTIFETPCDETTTTSTTTEVVGTVVVNNVPTTIFETPCDETTTTSTTTEVVGTVVVNNVPNPTTTTPIILTITQTSTVTQVVPTTTTLTEVVATTVTTTETVVQTKTCPVPTTITATTTHKSGCKHGKPCAHKTPAPKPTHHSYPFCFVQESFCKSIGQENITGNGTQVKTKSCSNTPQGTLPSFDNMISTLIRSPNDGEIISLGSNITVKIQSININYGFFDNPQQDYYTKPQTVGANGNINGHNHIVIEKISSSGDFPDPRTPVFFQGLDSNADDTNSLSTLVLSTVFTDSGIGLYRFCTLTSSQSHQPVLMGVARRGSADDCIRITII